MHRLESELVLPTTLEKAWAFIRNPRNLNRITPPEMHFEILTQLPEEMYDGLLIEYRVKIPLLGRTRWLTELKHIRPLHSFVDEQRCGPYAFWYHYHELTEVPGGIRFRDEVTYKMPFGLLGTLAHLLFAFNQLQGIFAYREKAMKAIFAADTPDPVQGDGTLDA